MEDTRYNKDKIHQTYIYFSFFHDQIMITLQQFTSMAFIFLRISEFFQFNLHTAQGHNSDT